MHSILSTKYKVDGCSKNHWSTRNRENTYCWNPSPTALSSVQVVSRQSIWGKIGESVQADFNYLLIPRQTFYSQCQAKWDLSIYFLTPLHILQKSSGGEAFEKKVGSKFEMAVQHLTQRAISLRKWWGPCALIVNTYTSCRGLERAIKRLQQVAGWDQGQSEDQEGHFRTSWAVHLAEAFFCVENNQEFSLIFPGEK